MRPLSELERLNDQTYLSFIKIVRGCVVLRLRLSDLEELAGITTDGRARTYFLPI